MAASSLLTLLDDIATLLDDVAVLTKVATKKTAGVLGDDLALNAEQVTGVEPDRELPVVWAVAKGSALNKVILVPVALLISWLAPWLILPLLMIGGLFLCFEGVEKVAHKLFHKEEEAEHHAELVTAVADPEVDLVAWEKEKIKGAIRTDFVLSAELIVITLGAVAGAEVGTRIGVMVAISIIMTVGVYGLVAGIVKLDDAGLALSRKESRAAQGFGRAILRVAPWLMKGLGIVGTIAMFLVGGGIVVHGVPGLEPLVHGWSAAAGGLGWLVSMLLNGAVGVLAGVIVLGVITGARRAFFEKASAH